MAALGDGKKQQSAAFDPNDIPSDVTSAKRQFAEMFGGF